MAHEDLNQVLMRSWRAIPADKAETTPFRAPVGWQDEPSYACPDCAQPMEKYGYMGLAAVQIDRCNPCSLVWLDANELQNMLLALAKANYRSEQAYQNEHDQAFPLWGVPVVSVETTDGDWLFGAAGRAELACQLLRLALRR